MVKAQLRKEINDLDERKAKIAAYLSTNNKNIAHLNIFTAEYEELTTRQDSLNQTIRNL